MLMGVVFSRRDMITHYSISQSELKTLQSMNVPPLSRFIRSLYKYKGF